MERTIRCDVLFLGALHFNWGDNKPGLLSCEFIMRPWFFQHVPEWGGYYSHYFPPPIPVHLSSCLTFTVTHYSREFSVEWDWGGEVFQNPGERRRIVKNRVLKYVIFASLALHPFINIHVSSHKDIHTHTLTTINGKDVFERRQKWKLYVSIYWIFSCLPLYMVSFNAYSNSLR